MNKQYGWLLVAALGLAGCGGGGGGGGNETPGSGQTQPGTPENQLTTEDLEGSWMRSVLVEESGQWKSVIHDTVIIRRTNSSAVRVRDCVENTEVTWTFANATLNRGDETSLKIIENGARMGATVENGSERTSYIYERIETTTNPKFASGSLAISLAGNGLLDASDFNQVCVATRLTPNSESSVKIRADYQSSIVNLAFSFDAPIAAQPYGYALPSLNGTTIVAHALGFTLNQPIGQMTVSEDTNRVRLKMESINFNLTPAVNGISDATVDGEISFHPVWLQGEPTRTD